MTVPSRVGSRALWGVAGAVAGFTYVYWVLFGCSLDTVVSLLSDDAFYYFEIARNIAHGEGCTFDGIVATNGFHPLWMLCVLPSFWLFGADLETPVRAILAGSGLLSLATLALLHRTVQCYIAPGVGALAVALCLLPNVLAAMTNGMETGILLFALTVLLWASYRYQIHEPTGGVASTFLFAVLLGVVSLCRLDCVFLLMAAFGLCVVSCLQRQLTARAVLVHLTVLLVAFGLTVAPYVIWNAAMFGHVMPVSGAMKSSFPLVRDRLTFGDDMPFGALLLVLLWAVTVGNVLADPDRCRRVQRAAASPLSLLTVACTLHYAHAFLFLTWGVYWWHFSLYGLALSVGVSQLVGRCAPRRARRVVVTTLVVCVLVVSSGLKLRELDIKGAKHRAWLDGAEWARASTPSDAVFAIKDAGLFGYFSDRRTVNLDGKANGYAYRDALNDDDLEAYLRQARVSYIADIHGRYTRECCRIRIPRVQRSACKLVMREAWEVYRSVPAPRGSRRFQGAGDVRFTVWRVPELGLVRGG